MDATQDDARYLPNLPSPSICRRPFSSSSSSSSSSPLGSKISAARKSSFHPPIGRSYADEDDEDDRNDTDEAVDEHDDDEDENDGGDRHRKIRGEEEEEEEEAESRGKRRKLDKFALGFEFAPRVPRPAIVTLEGKFPAKSSPTDWSEDSTFVLLDAWGDRYVQNGRKSLRSDEWCDVAKKVAQFSRTTRSDAQCRNRLDTLKKKYKKEKVRMAEQASPSSKWVYFKKMDELISSPSPPAAGARQQQPPQLSYGVDAGEYVFASSSVYPNRSNGNDETRDSPGGTGSEEDVDEEDDDDESDGLRPRREKVSMGSSDSSFRMLADSIQKFGEIYEKMESRKRQQMVELERMRKELQRDLEMHKRKVLERAQAEIAKIREEEGEEEEEESENDEDGDEVDVSADNLSG
ncbi:trihelix transcription factor ASIL2-like [Phoenix dactylifera]|uniref:Trihelix transcription factor ASIL2-like n=1 Tax=Phoenix dactylifera TaxID=42345 RepID=A0A8B8ZHV2_PHODC|nr:trihelix transcription factor ASIL2-like [Phoenix dactylifera]